MQVWGGQPSLEMAVTAAVRRSGGFACRWAVNGRGLCDLFEAKIAAGEGMAPGILASHVSCRWLEDGESGRCLLGDAKARRDYQA